MVSHISQFKFKLIKFVRISFNKNRSKLTPDVLRMIHFAFVYPLLLYGIEVYANTTANHLTSLRTLNNKYCEFCSKIPLAYR